MKKVINGFLLLITVVLFVACKKDTPSNQTGNPDVEPADYIVLGSDFSTVKMERMFNPTPTIDTIKYPNLNDSSFLIIETYGFDFYGRFDAFQIKRTHGYRVNTVNQKQYTNSISFACSLTVMEPVTEHYTISRSLNLDSVHGLSEYSIIPPLSTIEPTQVRSNFYPAAFSEGDTLGFSSGSISWKGKNSATVNDGGGTLHMHEQTMDYYYSYTDSIYKYRLYDNYYPRWKGVTEKYVVFSSSLGTETPKAGWVKISIGEDGSLTVHEFAYQVD